MICVGIVVIEGLKELLLVCDEKGKLGKYFMGFIIDIVKFEWVLVVGFRLFVILE